MLNALGMPRGLYNALMPALVLLVSWNGTLSMLQRRVVQTSCEPRKESKKYRERVLLFAHARRRPSRWSLQFDNLEFIVRYLQKAMIESLRALTRRVESVI